MSEEKPNITVTPRAIILDDTMVWLPYEEYQRLQKAIPIEWVKKYANRLIELENHNYFAYRGLGDAGEAILSMLEAWEKENETN